MEMKCSCCGIKISNWKGNFMATTLCDLCYFDLYNSGTKDENYHLVVVQENIRFRSKEKLKDIEEADNVLRK